MSGGEADSAWEALRAVEKLRRRGALREAMAACQVLIREAADRCEPLLLAATISRDIGEADRAVSFLDRALALEPAQADLHCDRGQLLRQNGNAEGAERAYQAALTIDSGFVRAHLALAELYDEADRPADAAYHLRVAIAVDPAQLDPRERLAIQLDEAGQAEQSATLRRETMRRARRRIAEAYTRIRTPSTAVSEQSTHRSRLAWAHALTAFGTAGAGLAKFQEQHGDVSGASETYAETLGVLTEAADQANSLEGLRRIFSMIALAISHCQYEMALLQERAGEFGGAVYHLEEAVLARPEIWPQGGEKLGQVANRCGASVEAVRNAVTQYLGRGIAPVPFPITRWNFSRYAKDWLVSVVRHRLQPEGVALRQIAIFSCNARDIQVSFAIACVLLARGHLVDFLWMPCLRFERSCDPAQADESWDEALLTQEMAQFGASELPGGLRIIDLRNFPPADQDIAQENAADRLAHLDVCAEARDRTYDVTKNPGMTQKRNRMAANLDALRRVAAYLDDTPVDQLILRNASTGEYGAAFHAARAEKVDVLVWESAKAESDAIRITHNRRHGDRDVSALWAADDPHTLNAECDEWVAGWLASRDGGDHRAIVPRQHHRPDGRAQLLLEDLDLDSSKPIVAMFIDRAWDETALNRESAFSSREDWLRWAVTFFGRQPEWQLVIRLPITEPGQDGPQANHALQAISDEMPGNLRIMDAAAESASYRLLEAAQLGLFYTDTIGLEMAMFGIHAITPARPFFAGFGFTEEAVNEEDYSRRIRQVLDDPVATAMTARQIELARCFAYLYFHHTPKPFPWRDGRFWQSISDEWTMDRVLGDEGRVRFEDTFANLSGEVPLPDGLIGRLG